MEPPSMNKFVIILATLLSGGSFWIAERAVNDLPGRVDANGRRLRMRVEGRGSPAVVFEIGLGGPLEVWDLVQPDLARHTTVVTYDRIGARDVKQVLTGVDIAHELHTALQKAGVKPPYVLVGQSFGGVYNRIFAGLYPDDVAGMVLLDPTQEEFLDWMKIHYPKRGLSKHIVRNLAEGEGVRETLNQLKTIAPPPDVPVIVVTGTKFIDDKMRIEALPVWIDAHRKWVSALPQGRHIKASKSGHGVQIDVPDLVVDLIREVVESARAERGEGELTSLSDEPRTTEVEL
jgi:pimeloyl-ACP methyl ester carboxylesterase